MVVWLIVDVGFDDDHFSLGFLLLLGLFARLLDFLMLFDVCSPCYQSDYDCQSKTTKNIADDLIIECLAVIVITLGVC